MRVLIALASLVASTAFAQTNPSDTDKGGSNPPADTGQRQPSNVGGQPGTTAGNLSPADENFVREAAATNQAEIKLGELAVQKGTTPQVRKYGQMMIDDHTRAMDRLQQIGKREGFTVPMQMTSEQRTSIDRLSAMSGKEFDTAYMDQMKQDHQQAIALFNNQAKTGTDPQLKSFAQTTLPSLHQHQEQASRPTKRM